MSGKLTTQDELLAIPEVRDAMDRKALSDVIELLDEILARPEVEKALLRLGYRVERIA
jgi:hypothetical protein